MRSPELLLQFNVKPRQRQNPATIFSINGDAVPIVVCGHRSSLKIAARFGCFDTYNHNVRIIRYKQAIILFL